MLLKPNPDTYIQKGDGVLDAVQSLQLLLFLVQAADLLLEAVGLGLDAAAG